MPFHPSRSTSHHLVAKSNWNPIHRLLNSCDYTSESLITAFGRDLAQLLWPCLLHASWHSPNSSTGAQYHSFRQRWGKKKSRYETSHLFQLDTDDDCGPGTIFISLNSRQTMDQIVHSTAIQLIEGVSDFCHRGKRDYRSGTCCRAVRALLDQHGHVSEMFGRRGQCVAAAEWYNLHISHQDAFLVLNALNHDEYLFFLQQLTNRSTDFLRELNHLKHNSTSFRASTRQLATVSSHLILSVDSFELVEGQHKLHLRLPSAEPMELSFTPGDSVKDLRAGLASELSKQQLDNIAAGAVEPVSYWSGTKRKWVAANAVGIDPDGLILEIPNLSWNILSQEPIRVIRSRDIIRARSSCKAEFCLRHNKIPDNFEFPEPSSNQDYIELLAVLVDRLVLVNAIFDSLNTGKAVETAIKLLRAAELTTFARQSAVDVLAEKIAASLEEIPQQGNLLLFGDDRERR